MNLTEFVQTFKRKLKMFYSTNFSYSEEQGIS